MLFHHEGFKQSLYMIDGMGRQGEVEAYDDVGEGSQMVAHATTDYGRCSYLNQSV